MMYTFIWMNNTQVYVNARNGDETYKRKKPTTTTVMGIYCNRKMIFELLYCT